MLISAMDAGATSQGGTELRFSGAGGESGHGAPNCLNAAEYEVGLAMYAARRLARFPAEEQLHDIDQFAWASDLARDWDQQPSGGMTLSELAVLHRRSYGPNARGAWSSAHAQISLTPIGVTVLGRPTPPDLLAQTTIANLATLAQPPRPRASAALFDGAIAHVVALSGVAEDEPRVQYHDPSDLSPFTASDSRVRARPDPDYVGVYRISQAALEENLVAVFWTPPDAQAFLAEREDDEAVELLTGATTWLSNYPGSRLATVCAALAMVDVLDSRGQREQATSWLRQAALVSGDGERLADRLPPHSLEAWYWKRLARAAQKGGNPWLMPPEAVPPDSETLYRRQGEPPVAKPVLQQALKLARNGDFNAAKPLFLEAYTRGNSHERGASCLYLGEALVGLGQAEHAVSWFKQAACSARVQFIGPACDRLGQIALDGGRPRDALAASERGAFTPEPEAAAACALRAAKIWSTDNQDVARAYFERARQSPDPLTRDAANEDLEGAA